MNKCFKCGELKPPMTSIAGCTYCPKCYAELTDKEAFFKKAREMAEGSSKEQLIEYYIAELETCCEVEEELKEYKIALKLACEFNATTTCNGQCQDCLHKEICDNTPKIDFRPIYADYFRTKAKEESKSE